MTSLDISVLPKLPIPDISVCSELYPIYTSDGYNVYYTKRGYKYYINNIDSYPLVTSIRFIYNDFSETKEELIDRSVVQNHETPWFFYKEEEDLDLNHGHIATKVIIESEGYESSETTEFRRTYAIGLADEWGVLTLL